MLCAFGSGCGSAPNAPGLGESRQAVTGCQLPLRGVNLSSAEFGSGANETGCPSCPGTYGTDYIYPIPSETTDPVKAPTGYDPSYFTSKGMNAFRVPFRWERLQRKLGDPLDSSELAKMWATIDYLTSIGAQGIILDPHNYARYMTSTIGQGVTAANLADFWGKVAYEFVAQPNVIYGLMNEPHDLPTETWRDAAQAAVNAIRATGSTQLILVPGNAFTGAWTWDQPVNGFTPSSDVMGSITDSGNHMAFEVHQYLDQNGSGKGRNNGCVSATIGSERLTNFTGWARGKKVRAFLGEIGTGNSSTCLSAVDDLLKYMEKNTDVWLGWTWWAAGPWWQNYFLGLDPTSTGADQPQMTTLLPHIAWEGPSTNCPPPIAPPAPTTGSGGAGGAPSKDGGSAGTAGKPKTDAAGTAGAGGAAGAGVDPTTDPPAEEETPAESASGCKCGMAGGDGRASLWLVALGLAAVTGLRRRR